MTIYWRNLKLVEHEDVYEPAEDSFLLALNLNIEPSWDVLDMGCGTGIQALTAAATAKTVLAVDINPTAIELAKRNAEINCINNVEFRQSDLFVNIGSGESFDLIIFNPPYLPSPECGGESLIEKSWNGGLKGGELIDRFIREAPGHLKCGGSILLLVSSLNALEEIEDLIRQMGLESQTVAKEKLWFEELYVLWITRGEKSAGTDGPDR